VRIDESRMIVYALTERGEAKIPLNANCRDEQYIRNVKGLLSSHSLGSPGGYPVYLKRWTRMGQAKDDSLEQLLKLGESEAVVAVVHATGLSNELARRAWWCMPSSDNARRMLEKEDVINGDMGSVLAMHLIEHLPFEEDQLAMIDSVKVALQPGLISAEMRQSLWDKAKQKGSFYVGFLQASPDDLPITAREHVLHQRLKQQLPVNNPYTECLLRVTSQAGQGFLDTVEAALKRPNNQDVIVALFEVLEHYFAAIKPAFENQRDINEIMAQVERHCESASDDLAIFLSAAENVLPYAKAMMILSAYCEVLCFPVFGQTDAIGSVMRKKIKHLTEPLKQQLAILRK